MAHSDGRKIDEAMERGRAALALWRELGMKWLGVRPGHLGIRQNVDLIIIIIATIIPIITIFSDIVLFSSVHSFTHTHTHFCCYVQTLGSPSFHRLP